MFCVIAFCCNKKVTKCLKGAGQFNLLEMVPEEMWDMLEMMI